LLLSFGPVLGWLVAATWAAPAGYVNASFWDNVVMRFFAGTSHARPVWFYLQALPRGFLPWTLLWPAVWRRHRTVAREAPAGDEARAWRFLLWSLGAAVAFFSFSAGKRGVYLVPVYPLLAIACAEVLARWIAEGGAAPRWLRRSLRVVAVLPLAAPAAAPLVERAAGLDVPAAFWGMLAASSCVAWLVARALRPAAGERAALVGASAAGIVSIVLALQLALYPALDSRHSHRALAEIARDVTPVGAAIGIHRNDTLASAIAYYAGRPVRRLRDASEMTELLSSSGWTVVAEDDELAEIAAHTPLREVGRARIRQRVFHVLKKQDAGMR
jgi:hypothetical protein